MSVYHLFACSLLVIENRLTLRKLEAALRIVMRMRHQRGMFYLHTSDGSGWKTETI